MEAGLDILLQHSSYPGQRETEIVQRQKIGEAVDEQRHNPNGSNYEQCAVLRKDLLVQVSFLNAQVPIESRQGHEIYEHLGQNSHCESVVSAQPIAEEPPAVNDGVNCQGHDSRSG